MSLLTYDLLNLDATSLSELIISRKMSIEEIVTAYIKHIQTINPSLNALVEERFTEALKEAKQKDKQLPANISDQPFYGIPISIKESLNVKNMKTTGGLIHRKNFVAKEDAAVVHTLKNAGAIILGKTNTPTLCFCQETDNKLYGRTNNPWDLTRTSGGSSGGEGALLAAGGSAIGIGSDIGGSIRVPSHFNGIVGFKPGKFQVSSEGHFPSFSIPLQQRMEAIGPMGKSVRDIRRLYQLIANKPMTTQSLENVTIDILPSSIPYPLSQDTIHMLNTVEQFLNKDFPTTRQIPPFFNESAQLWQEIMSIDGGDHIKKLAFAKNSSNLIFSFIKEKLTKNTDMHQYLTWALIGTKTFKPSKKRIKEIKTIIAEGDQTLDEYLQHRLLIFPIYHTTALPHGNVYREIFSIRKTFLKYMPYIAYSNVWGLPSLVVPINHDDNSPPMGIQIMSANGNEDNIFKLGELLEGNFYLFKRCYHLNH